MIKSKIVIASVSDREKLVAELWIGDAQWAELSHDSGTPILQIYANPFGLAWEFPLKDVIELLQKAKSELLGSVDGHAV